MRTLNTHHTRSPSLNTSDITMTTIDQPTLVTVSERLTGEFSVVYARRRERSYLLLALPPTELTTPAG